jgi:uncharacterized membrane protein YfcA
LRTTLQPRIWRSLSDKKQLFKEPYSIQNYGILYLITAKESVLDLYYIISGIFVGVLSGFFGIGGGTILIPILIWSGMDIKEAIGISIIQMVFSSYFGTYLNFKMGNLKIPSTIFLGIGGALGAILGPTITIYLSSKSLTYIFLSVIILTIYNFFYSFKESNKRPIINRTLFTAIGFFIGVFSTSIGVGGSILLTPILVGFLRFKIKDAISIGLLFVLFSSTSALISFYLHTVLNIHMGVIVGLSSLVGVYIGIKASQKIKPQKLKILLLLLNFVILGVILYKLV